MRFKAYSGNKVSSYFKISTRTWFVIHVHCSCRPSFIKPLQKSVPHETLRQTCYRPTTMIFMGNNQIQISFKPMGHDKTIVKHLKVTHNTLMDRQNRWVMIRFSKANPKIIEVV